jgi:ribosomal protein S18 acetylase RimI-like enzyme
MYVTAPLTPADIEAGFSSGVHPLDDFFRRHALGNQASGICTTFVLRDQENPTAAIVGFYTLSMASLPSATIAPHVSSKLPRYDMPVALIGRLAVHSQKQRCGIGTKLLVDAINRVLEISTGVGCVGIIVDAKNETAVKFYTAHGFVAVGAGTPTRLFVPMATLRAAAS